MSQNDITDACASDRAASFVDSDEVTSVVCVSVVDDELDVDNASLVVATVVAVDGRTVDADCSTAGGVAVISLLFGVPMNSVNDSSSVDVVL
jgi:hypothetical protein